MKIAIVAVAVLTATSLAACGATESNPTTTATKNVPALSPSPLAPQPKASARAKAKAAKEQAAKKAAQANAETKKESAPPSAPSALARVCGDYSGSQGDMCEVGFDECRYDDVFKREVQRYYRSQGPTLDVIAERITNQSGLQSDTPQWYAAFDGCYAGLKNVYDHLST
jgi:hypothetical protein